MKKIIALLMLFLFLLPSAFAYADLESENSNQVEAPSEKEILYDKYENIITMLEKKDYDGAIDAITKEKEAAAKKVSTEDKNSNNMSDYKAVIESLVNGDGTVSNSQYSYVVANSDNVYHVIVGDASGNLVPGVKLTFYNRTEDSIETAKTDDNGVASFNAEEGNIYSIAVWKVPKGYEEPNDQYDVTVDTYSDVFFILK